MNLKILALIAVVTSFVLYTVALIYETPIAYMPYEVTALEFVSYNVVSIVFETAIFSFLFMTMIVKSKFDFTY